MRNVKGFIFFVAIFIAPTILLAQATVSHGFRQDIEISVDGKGGPTLIKQGESKIIPYLPKSGNVSIRIRYKEGRRFVEKIANNVKVSNGQLFLPEAPKAAVVQASATKQTNKAQTQKPNQNSADQGDYSPKVGEVNIIKKLSTAIEKFPVQVINKSKKGDLMFVGSAFTGAVVGENDTLISIEDVSPGILELNVIYKEIIYGADGAAQSFFLAQQSLIFMVTDPNQIIEIDNSQFFDFASLLPNMKVRFKNVGDDITLFSMPVSKPLRPGRMSKAYKYEDACKVTWHFNDENNLRRMTVWNYVPDSRIIRIKSFDDIFGVGH